VFSAGIHQKNKNKDPSLFGKDTLYLVPEARDMGVVNKISRLARGMPRPDATVGQTGREGMDRGSRALRSAAAFVGEEGGLVGGWGGGGGVAGGGQDLSSWPTSSPQRDAYLTLPARTGGHFIPGRRTRLWRSPGDRHRPGRRSCTDGGSPVTAPKAALSADVGGRGRRWMRRSRGGRLASQYGDG